MVDDSQADEPRTPPMPDASEFGLEQFGSVSDDQGISLDELSKAYAQLIGKGEDPYDPPEEPALPNAEDIIDQPDDPDEEDACVLCPRSIVEAILFVGNPNNESISSRRIASLMRGVPPREIDELVAELNADYLTRGHPYHIVSSGTGYRMELRNEFASLRNVFYGRIRETRLSQAAIDVLAVVAYQPGRARTDIDAVRGRPSAAILTQLVRRRLLRMERPDQKPRTPRYFPTDRFLELFGLESLDDLPRSQDIE